MRIGLVCGDFVPEYSSNERELARGLVELGHDVTVFTSDRKPSRFFKANEKIAEGTDTSFDFKVSRLPTLFSFKGFHYMSKLEENILAADLDVIHTVECFPPHSWHALNASIEKDVPLTFTQHQYYVPTGGLGLLFGFLDRTKSKGVIARSGKVCAVSGAAKTFLMNHYSLADERIALTFSPVNTKVFKPSNRRRSNQNLTVLTVARLTKSKGLKYLIMAFKSLTEEFSEARLVIVGRGPDRERLVKLTAALRIEDKVAFSDEYVPNEEMPLIYNSCSVFVLPSLVEPVGIAAIEALSCGLPIIATDVGGLSDVVTHDKNGLLVPPRDSGSIAERLSVLLRDDGLRKNLVRPLVKEPLRNLTISKSLEKLWPFMRL